MNDEYADFIRRNAQLRVDVESDRKEVDLLTSSVQRNVKINGFSVLIEDAMKRKERA